MASLDRAFDSIERSQVNAQWDAPHLAALLKSIEGLRIENRGRFPVRPVLARASWPKQPDLDRGAVVFIREDGTWVLESPVEVPSGTRVRLVDAVLPADHPTEAPPHEQWVEILTCRAGRRPSDPENQLWVLTARVIPTAEPNPITDVFAHWTP